MITYQCPDTYSRHNRQQKCQQNDRPIVANSCAPVLNSSADGVLSSYKNDAEKFKKLEIGKILFVLLIIVALHRKYKVNFILHDFVQLGFIIHRMVFITNNSFVFFVCGAAYVKSKFQNVGQNAVYLVTSLILNDVRFHVTNGEVTYRRQRGFRGNAKK